ncbi:flagellar biosynthetic protein FliR [Blastomonas sp.]|uniref:flagellar biosynthetic protein FliR n=1 Tax=Blastomonas sp. TaxID=1909299 RepID=UPI0035946912
MIAPGFAGVEAQLWVWIMAMIRPGAAMMVAPVFGATSVPLQVRIILSAMIGIAATNSTPMVLPEGTLVSFSGLLFILAEVLAGVAMGFALQVGYSAAFVAGETISNTMGLGFASMNDPMTGASTPVIGQFLSIIAVLLLLAMDGHLMLIAIIVQSYVSLPPGDAFLSPDVIFNLVEFGGTLFAMGLVIALPVGAALILVQVVMAMLARSAPQLNLFSVGIPVAVLAGILLLALAAPVLADGVMRAIEAGLEQSEVMAGG